VRQAALASRLPSNSLRKACRDRAYVFTDDHSVEQVEARLREIIAARDDVLPEST
jgi:hypothetical protein